MDTSLAPASDPTSGAGRAHRVSAWVRHQAVAAARVVTQVVVSVRDAVRRRTASPDVVADHGHRAAPDPPDERPQWGVVAIATAITGGLLALRMSPASSLYWYVFPLFGLGIAFVVQFRSQLSGRWWAVLAASAVLGALGVARDWAFSGHVLFNVVFLGHAALVPARRTWMLVLLASLVHLFATKFAFQRPRDVVGGFISLALALAALPLAGRRRTSGPSPLVA